MEEKTQRRSQYMRMLLTGLLAVAIILGANTVLERRHTAIPPLPKEVSQKLLFSAHLPSKLPPGFTINSASYTFREGALLYTAQSTHGDTIVFSEQDPPKEIDATQFYETNIKNPVHLSGAHLRTVFGQQLNGKGFIAGITTDDDTWVLLTSSSQLSKNDVKGISNGLQKQHTD